MLNAGLDRLPATTKTLDAWTRDDEPALAWYRGRGFTESDHYLHVHKGYDGPVDGFTSPDGLSSPLLAFCHAQVDDEDRLRRTYGRVHVCRRFTLTLGSRH